MIFKIYGKQGCVACEQAKQFLRSKNLKFKYFNLDKDYSIDDLRMIFGENVNSVPQITVESESLGTVIIGGLNQLRRFDI
jgi:glutaredoxin